MEEYISKTALAAKIKKRIKETKSMQPKFDQFWAGQISAFKGVLKILDTLEVKEVDLIKEVANWKIDHQVYGMDETFYDFAKHFFELGMAVSNKAQKGE